MAISAKDIQKLREIAGVGMMDAKKALEACDGDFEAAKKHLREKGLAKAAERADRENTQGAVAVSIKGNVGAIAQLKSETDFVAKSPDFVKFVQDLADAVAARGEGATAELQERLDQMIVSLKEKIELGRIVRFEAPAGSLLDSYLHVQSERGVNAVLVEVAGASQEVAHDLALHIAFARPQFLQREDVPAEVVAAERATLETITRNEGKPEAALPKIVEGRLGGFFKERCLLEQEWAKDNKVTIKQLLGSGSCTRFAQVEIG